MQESETHNVETFGEQTPRLDIGYVQDQLPRRRHDKIKR